LFGGLRGLTPHKSGGLPTVTTAEQEITNVKIIVKANDPYVVKGDIELFDTAGKPSSDATHGKVGFRAATQAPVPGRAPMA